MSRIMTRDRFMEDAASSMSLGNHGAFARMADHDRAMRALIAELDHALRARIRGCACDNGGDDGELLARSRAVKS